MAKSSLGKLVSRVGASGGGKTYAKARPTAYYSLLSLIVVVGLSSVVYSRYERQNPVVASKVFPAKGTVGYVSYIAEDCGTPITNYLSPSPSPSNGYSVLLKDVIELEPTTDAEAGLNATVGSMIANVSGMSFTSKKMVIPKALDKGTKPETFVAGAVCAKGTKYAGQKAYPEVAYWTTLSQRKPSISSDPSAVQLTANMLVTLAFDPKGVTPGLPANATIQYMYSQSPSATTTTTTAAPSSSSTTTTTSAVTTTTKG